MTIEVSLVEQFKLCHSQLDELFLLHQEALLEGKLEKAATILASYQSCHSLHSQYEDDLLIPKYAELLEQGKWNATLYAQEHQKIEDLHKKVEEALLWLIKQDLRPSQQRRNIIKLLDREKSFKGLCEHHQEREEDSLLFELDRQTDVLWRLKVSDSFSTLWEKKFKTELESIKNLL